MDNAIRYDRWLSMAAALVFLYLAFQHIQDGSSVEALFAACVVFLMLRSLYKRRTITWQQVAVDLGGAVLTMLIIGLIAWGYFLISL